MLFQVQNILQVTEGMQSIVRLYPGMGDANPVAVFCIDGCHPQEITGLNLPFRAVTNEPCLMDTALQHDCGRMKYLRFWFSDA